jgi:hypothetical protein
MELFKLNEDFLVDINKEWIQLHEAFKKVYLRDKGNNSNHYKGRFKFQAQKEFTYIYLLCDYRSNLTQYSEEDREKQARIDAGLEPGWKPDKEIKDAIERYRELQNTRSLKLLNACYKTVDQLTEFFNNFTTEDVEEAGKVITAISKVGTVLEGLRKQEDQVKKEMSETVSIRGGGELGYDELNRDAYINAN